jgi:hypothetical protein
MKIEPVNTPPKLNKCDNWLGCGSRLAGMVGVSFVRLMSNFRAVQYNV